MSSIRLGRLTLSGVVALAAAILSVAPALAGGSDWKVGYYTPSNQTLSTASADRPGSSLAALNFTSEPNTALLVTTHGASKGSLLGVASEPADIVCPPREEHLILASREARDSGDASRPPHASGRHSWNRSGSPRHKRDVNRRRVSGAVLVDRLHARSLCHN